MCVGAAGKALDAFGGTYRYHVLSSGWTSQSLHRLLFFTTIAFFFFLSLQTQAAGLAAYQNRSLEFWGQINSLVPSDSSAQRDYALLTGLRLAFFFSRDRDISTIVRRVRKLQVHPEDYRSVRPMVGVRVRGWGASRLACHDDELIQHRFFL